VPKTTRLREEIDMSDAAAKVKEIIANELGVEL